MTEEEMRAKITEQEKSISALTDERDTYKSQLEVKDEQITSLNSTVNDLKQKNYDLFIQVSKPIDNKKETNNETQEEKTMSVSDIASKLIGGN